MVDLGQASFIEGRSIVDNIHLTQELLRKYARKRISPRYMLKVDIQKACDSVDWGFLKQVLLTLNFPLRFVWWIMECVGSTSYSVSLNGQYHGHIIGRKGLRQGDSLSSFLFAFCLEVLSRMLRHVTRVSIIPFCLSP